MEPLVTVELQLRSDLLFSFRHPDRIGHQLHRLPRACSIRHNAFIVEVANHGQVQHPLAGLDVGDVRYPLLVGTLRVEIPVQQVRIAVQMIHGPAVSLPAADLGKQAIRPHDAQDRFPVETDPFLPLQPDLYSPVTVGSAALPMALADHLSDVRIFFRRVQMLHITVISAARDTEKSTHGLDGILLPVLVNYSKFDPRPHLFSWLR